MIVYCHRVLIVALLQFCVGGAAGVYAAYGHPGTSSLARSVELVVAPDGRDGQAGTVEAPLKSIAAALDRVESTLAQDPNTDVVIYLREGTYYLTETLHLTADHSPAGGHQLRIRPYRGERATVSSAVPLTEWRAVSNAVLGFPERAKGKLYVSQVPADQGRPYSLYLEEHRLDNAESEGFSPAKMPAEWIEFAYDPAVRRDFTRLQLEPGSALASISNPQHGELRVIPKWPWTMNILPISRVDRDSNTLHTALPGTYGLYRTQWRGEVYTSAWLLNLPEHLDQPGEWVYDPATHQVYLWPELPGAPEGVYLPTLRELLLIGGTDERPARNISVEGLRFIHGARDYLGPDDAGLQHDFEYYDKGNALVRLRNAEDCRITGCTLTASGGSGIRLDLHAQRNLISDNTLTHLGGTGILLAGYGPGTKDVNHGNTVANNHISHIGESLWSSPGIMVWQSGDNLISRNVLHDLPYSGIIVSGVRPEDFDRRNRGLRREATPTIRFAEVPERDIEGLGTYADYRAYAPFLHSRNNRVDGNEVYRCVLSMGDGNALYVSGAGGGNQLTNNYLHDSYAPGLIQLIRCDDYQEDVTIAFNRLEDAVSGGISIKGRNDIIGNRIINVMDRSASADQPLEARGYILLRGPAQGSVIRDNVLHHRGGPARIFEEGRAFGQDGGTTLEECVVRGNVIYHEQSPAYSRRLQEDYLKRGVNLGGAVMNTLGR